MPQIADQTLSFRAQVAGILLRAVGAGSFQERIEAFVAQARQLAADGLSLADAAHLFTALLTMAIGQATHLNNTGADKKQFVLQAVAYLYDAIAPQIWLPIFVSPFRIWLRPYIRSFIVSLADGAIEAIYARMKAA